MSAPIVSRLPRQVSSEGGILQNPEPETYFHLRKRFTALKGLFEEPYTAERFGKAKVYYYSSHAT